ncbi:MAG: pyrroline-5-carboxylate reductase [Candidatus Omnitrophica bacterium]|nr:pyrroline-5-carboxylate reductase [Candidatus Omnitrophota bacterium]
MKKNIKIGIIGWGNMGSSLGLALQEEKKWQIYFYDKDKKKGRGINPVRDSLPLGKRLISNGVKYSHICKNAKELIEKVEVVILAIKPQDIRGFLQGNSEYFNEFKPLLITIAAGISTTFFQKYLKDARMIRVMPNLAIGVKQSVSFLCKGKFAKDSDLKMTKKIFSSVGEVFQVKESFLDKATSITGSGPGYIYYIMECVYKLALKLGFAKETAKRMVTSTFLGAAKLAKQSRKDFEVLVKEVASSGGTTEAALNVFKEKNIAEIIEEGVAAAYKKAKEIAGSYH